MSDCIEGVDYIFDRYAFLNLPKDASVEEIRVVLRKMRAENHPDKLLRASDAIKDVAKAQIDLVDRCERALLNPDVKPLYDLKLAQFIENEPRLVSTSGMPIQDLSRLKINLDYLLGTQVSDLTELEAHVMKMTGYSPQKVEKAMSRYQRNPDWEYKDELREVLTTKLVFLSVLEDYYWQKAGIHGGVSKDDHKAQSTDDLLKNFESLVSNFKTHAEKALNNRSGAALLGFTPPLLLGNSSAPQNNLIHEVMKSFELRAEDLRRLMAEKTQTLKELSKVCRAAKLVPDKGTLFCDYILIHLDEEMMQDWPQGQFEVLPVSLRFNQDNKSLEAFTFPHSVCSKEMLGDYPNQLWVVEPNKEISAILLEVMELINAPLENSEE